MLRSIFVQIPVLVNVKEVSFANLETLKDKIIKNIFIENTSYTSDGDTRFQEDLALVLADGKTTTNTIFQIPKSFLGFDTLSPIKIDACISLQNSKLKLYTPSVTPGTFEMCVFYEE